MRTVHNISTHHLGNIVWLVGPHGVSGSPHQHGPPSSRHPPSIVGASGSSIQGPVGLGAILRQACDSGSSLMNFMRANFSETFLQLRACAGSNGRRSTTPTLGSEPKIHPSCTLSTRFCHAEAADHRPELRINMPLHIGLIAHQPREASPKHTRFCHAEVAGHHPELRINIGIVGDYPPSMAPSHHAHDFPCC